MRNRLEKFHSLMQGMLFSGGYLPPSAVIDAAAKPQAIEKPGADERTESTTARPNVVARGLAHSLVCDLRWINPR